MKIRCALLCAWLLGLGPCIAQENSQEMWSATLPGGTFVVRLSAVTSVSRHEYVVDGAARVNEVVIATTGSLIGRFYFLEPVRPTTPTGLGQSSVNAVIDKLEQAADRVDVEPLWKKVVKSYPVATHAHTVEYRLESMDQVQALFDHASEAWRAGRGAEFSPE